MLPHGRACPRGLAAWGVGKPVGLGVKGACLRKGQHFQGAVEGKAVPLSKLMIDLGF